MIKDYLNTWYEYSHHRVINTIISISLLDLKAVAGQTKAPLAALLLAPIFTHRFLPKSRRPRRSWLDSMILPRAVECSLAKSFFIIRWHMVPKGGFSFLWKSRSLSNIDWIEKNSFLRCGKGRSWGYSRRAMDGAWWICFSRNETNHC